MTIDLSERIEELFHAVVDLDHGKREDVLANEDKTVRSEVLSLVEAYKSNPDLMDGSAFELGLAVIESESEENLTGQAIGQYEIRELLGRGGMGRVYLAYDINLDRQVALKFLSTSLAKDTWARKQLIREAKAVAALDHPNICPVFGYDEVGEHRFMVMQYVEGKSLAEMIDNGSIDPRTIVPIAVEIAEAISAAHSRNIIHRDIKPGNIMITPDGRVKILDFGLAKFIPGSHPGGTRNLTLGKQTEPGLIFGTVAYMSPEQLKAERLDFRTDIFSIGTVLFELAAGRHPFERKSDAETISAILNDDTTIGDVYNPRIPHVLGPIIRKCLKKKKEDRYGSTAELLLDLTQPVRPTRRLDRKWWLASAIILVLLSLFLGYKLVFSERRVPTLTVLPYQNHTGDPSIDYVAEGIVDGLGIKLASFSRLKMRSFQSLPPDIDPVDFGRRNSIDLIVTGELVTQDDQPMLRSALIDVESGAEKRVWLAPLNSAELPALEKGLAEELLASLDLGATTQPSRRGSFTDNGEAARQYFVGRHYWKQRDRHNIQLAIEAFQRSIDADPGFARAYVGLADCYVLLNLVSYGTVTTKEAMTKARAAARQALEIDPLDAQAHSSLGLVLAKYDWNWVHAEAEYQQAIQIDPEYAPAHYWYSSLLAILGRTDEAIREATRAKELDPFSPLADINLARTYYYARRWDDARTVLERAASRDKKAHYLAALIDLQTGRVDEAETVLEEISKENKMLAAAALGFTYARLGKRSAAMSIATDLKDSAATSYVPPQEVAIIYVGLGDNQTAIQYLRDSFGERHAALISLAVEPLFDPLRDEPAFAELLRQMALPDRSQLEISRP